MQARSKWRARRLSVLFASVAALILNTAAASAGEPAPDLSIVADLRQLTASEVRAHDITSSERGRQTLAAEASALDLNRRSYQVFAFDDMEVIVDATTTIAVVSGKNRAGNLVYDVLPQATGAEVVDRAGYAVPPSSAWLYNNDGSWTTTVGTWKRTGFWTLTKANNYKTSSTATAYDYWRVFVKMQAATLTGASADEGFKRAWVELDVTNGGTSPAVFEVGQPEESYGGVANQTTTVGFGSNYTFTLGAAPLTAGGGTSTTYGGSMTKSSENWHPVVRSEAGSGGVQWCRYEEPEFTGTKIISAREGLRVSSTSAAPTWQFLTGQSQSFFSCPSQV